MSFTLVFHSFNSSRRAGLARQLLLAGAALLLASSTFAQTPAKSEKAPRILIVTDSVRIAGSRISGGWREYAADWSWRRVVFTLDDHTATIVFSDGKPGSRLPSVTHYAARRYASDAKHYASEHFLLELDGPPGGLMPSMTNDARSGPGSKGSPATYDEIRIFPGTTPVILDKAKQSSPIPSDVATRIREIGGDIKVMQQMADFKRISELGSALDAARATDDGGFFPDRPGGSLGEANWSAPWRGVGRGGAASDDTKIPGHDGGPKDTVERRAGGATTTTTHRDDGRGNRGSDSQDRDASGNVTGGFSYAESRNGDRTTTISTRDPSTDTTTSRIHEDYGDGRPSRDRVEVYRHGRRVRAPSEVPFSGRGGFDEAWMDKSLPWLMDAYYSQWKRESDLVKSGGRISQPGRGEQPTLVLNEGPEVGAEGVVNCGAETNPCARAEGTETDTRGRLSELTQPPRDGLTGGPLGGTGGPLGGGGGPFPPPNPQLKP